MRNFLKSRKIKFILTGLVVFLPLLALVTPALARPNLGLDYVAPLNLANADPRDAAVSLIALLMTFLGIIAVVIILYGGFVWLTAAGNEEKVSRAKKIITAAVIGLIIILAAYLIVGFVERNVSTALNGG
jgi:hypothetical protein